MLVMLALLLSAGIAHSASAQDGNGQEMRKSVLAKLCLRKTDPRLEAIEQILKSAAEAADTAVWARTILTAANEKKLLCAGDIVAIRSGDALQDAITLAPLGEQTARLSGPFVNLKMRASLDMGVAQLMLLTASTRGDLQDALALMEKKPDLVEPAVLNAAIQLQMDNAIKKRLEAIQGVRLLRDDDIDNRLGAIALVAARPTQNSLTTLLNLAADPDYAADPRVSAALDDGIAQIRRWLRFGEIASVVFSGMSYASILFLASLGLAIIFGLMGVINLAQGELIMVGAYATYLVQEILRLIAPGLLDFYLLLAIPFAFLLATGVGLIMEITVIRHLYRRPLVTLLATWAVSLLLINTVRVLFGTQNLEFITPGFLAGGERLFGDFIITWNRLFAILFALAGFFIALFTLKATRLGLYIRAVTYNRDMAGCVGVSARRVDLLSFGIGSGLAGVAGLVLSPIYNVNPTMGSNFIVDAFMIVVLGGVGSIAGTLVASIGVGMVNVAIEPIYGAVAAKVIVLLMIIIFIQFRPEGLFVVRGRK
jgi:urea transport system permease protein